MNLATQAAEAAKVLDKNFKCALQLALKKAKALS